MSIVLPEVPVEATRVDPKILILYGLPKVGKTEELARLPGCLTIDTEGGTDMYTMLKQRIYNASEFYEVIKDVEAKGLQRKNEGKTGADQFPYKYIALDTIDELETFAEREATRIYKDSVIGKSFRGDSVLELPMGGGYYYLRTELTRMVDRIASVCPRLIIIAHVKEKLLSKGGEDVKVNDISLTGKLGSIIAAKADAIGYLYREQGKPGLKVSFETYESTVMGARCKHLAGQKFDFDWKRIYTQDIN